MIIPMSEIVKAASAAGGVSKIQLIGECRDRNFIDLRTAVCVIGRREGHSLTRIGRSIDRDHTTVLHHLRRAGQMVGAALDDHLDLIAKIERAAIEKISFCECGASIPQSQTRHPRRVCDDCRAATQRQRSRRFRENLAAKEAWQETNGGHEIVKPPPLERDRSQVCSPEWWANNDARFRAAITALLPVSEAAE